MVEINAVASDRVAKLKYFMKEGCAESKVSAGAYVAKSLHIPRVVAMMDAL